MSCRYCYSHCYYLVFVILISVGIRRGNASFVPLVSNDGTVRASLSFYRGHSGGLNHREHRNGHWDHYLGDIHKIGDGSCNRRRSIGSLSSSGSSNNNINKGGARLSVRNTTKKNVVYLHSSASGSSEGVNESANEDGEEVESDGGTFTMPSAETLISDLSESERGIGVGIDLGTTNSAVSIFSDDGIPRLIKIDGKTTMPSVVSISVPKISNERADDDDHDDGGGDRAPQILVGNPCLEREAMDDEQSQTSTDTDTDTNVNTHTYRHVKRVMGMGITSAASNAEVVPHVIVRTASQRRKGRSMNRMNKDQGLGALNLPQIMKDARDNPARLSLPMGCPPLEQSTVIQTDTDTDTDTDTETDTGTGTETNTVDDIATKDATVDNDTTSTVTNTISPEYISSVILKKLFNTVEQATGETITRAVIGVPAYFNDVQQEATIKAATLASSIPRERIRLLREPEAAALAYGIGKRQISRESDDELVLVFDLGGGTFDVSILEVGGGIYEVLATGGNNMLGGSDFDAEIARRLFSKKVGEFGGSGSGGNNGVNYWKEGGDVAAAMVKTGERVRIALSNTKEVVLGLPTTGAGWLTLDREGDVGDVILWKASDGDAKATERYASVDEKGTLNGTLIEIRLTRKGMETMCFDEFQALLRPVREVAILAGALLPGDASPSALSAVLDMEQAADDDALFESFFDPDTGEVRQQADPQIDGDGDGDSVDADTLLRLKDFERGDRKRAQQGGRKRARNLQRNERKFRQEKRRAAEEARSRADDAGGGKKVQDGINGRRLTQVVLVGGATRMPAIGRLLAAVTGVVPQRTVNPDEAVALGCAVQVGILDGINTDLQVLSPFEAAMLRAVAKKRGLDVRDNDDDDADDDLE